MAGDRPLNWEVMASLGGMRLKQLKQEPELTPWVPFSAFLTARPAGYWIMGYSKGNAFRVLLKGRLEGSVS